MKILDVFYYSSFSFYTRFLKESEPHLSSTLALSFLESLIVNGIFEWIAVHFYCKDLDKWIMISILLVVLGINYLYYHSTSRASDILKSKPIFFNNHVLTQRITSILAIFSISLLFWGPIYLKNALDQCR